MQQKITKLGVGESHSFFQTINTEAPKHQINIPTNSTQKIKICSNQIQKTESSNNTNNINSVNNFNEENINELNNANLLNSNINNSLDNENNSQFHSGRWTEEEHQKFIDGILQYGNEWKKVQQIIRTRSSTQARSHAQKFFLRVKKLIKNNGGNFNINEKDKISENIIDNIIPNKKGETLTKSQKEKLLSAISSNIKYEGETNERSEEELELGLEEQNLKYKKDYNENNTIFKYHKNSSDIQNSNKSNNIFRQRKISIGQKRKLSKTDSRDKIFFIQKDISHKPSLDLSIQNNNKSENNETNVQNNINNIILNENEINPENKYFECNKKNNFPNANNAGLNNNPFINIDNNDNKNNLNGYIINNYINVTNNYMNNKYICNFCNNDLNNNINYNYNYYQDFYNYNYEKNDSINNDRNYNFCTFSQCPDKNIFNNSEKPLLFGNNQFKQNFYNTFNFNNNKINNYNENENLNNGTNPFDINFNNFNNYNYNNNENEQQISIHDDEFLKLNNNEDNNDYN